MLKVGFHDLNEIEDKKIQFVVIHARYKGKWVFAKHKERETWETPGGKREANENIEIAASRELYEETGAREYTLIPVCIYSVECNGSITYGLLYYCDIIVLDKLPESEIIKVQLFDDIPVDLTYPDIQPYLYKRVNKFLELNRAITVK